MIFFIKLDLYFDNLKSNILDQFLEKTCFYKASDGFFRSDHVCLSSLWHRIARRPKFCQNEVLMSASFWQNFSLLAPLRQKLKKRTLDGAKRVLGRISKIIILHSPNTSEHGLLPLLASSFCLLMSTFGEAMNCLLNEISFPKNLSMCVFN